jgi:hypothetical protein
MAELTLETQDDKTQFAPGEMIEGTAGWEVDQRPEEATLCLFWHTAGKGEQDVGIATKMVFEEPGNIETRAFSLQAPEAPYSFSGKLITLTWSLELLIEPGHEVQRVDLVISPAAEELQLSELPGGEG